jgi:HEPN domain-containing protein
MSRTPATPSHPSPVIASPAPPPPASKPKGSTPKELRSLARLRLAEAKILLANKKYDGATYLCGYAIELALKARICETLKWTAYNISRDYDTFKTHDLSRLLDLSGIRPRIITKYFPDWSSVNKWDSKDRYLPVNHTKPQIAMEMIDASTRLLKTI